MEQNIAEEIRRFAAESRANRFPDSDAPYFDAPLVGFTAADDPLFTDYKRIIGPFHQTPRELAQASRDGDDWQPATVVCWVLPITHATRESNRGESRYPSRA